MRLDIAEELTKPLGHLCVERGIKATEYMNAAVRAALVKDGKIPPDDDIPDDLPPAREFADLPPKDCPERCES